MKLTVGALIAAVAAVSFFSADEAVAQAYPSRPIKLIVPFPPGGSTDVMARSLAESLRPKLGTVVIENKAGAGGMIGAEAAASAPADGYTLLYGSDSLVIQPLINKETKTNLRDFIPLARVRLSSTFLAVHPSVPANNVREFVALLKAKPDSLRYATGGSGTILHLAGELFKTKTGIVMEHIPYRGESPALIDFIAGRVEAIVAGAATLGPLAEQGKARILAASTEMRSPTLPNIPTYVESGYPDVVVANWNGVLAPKGTPPDIVNKLTDAIAEAANSPEFLERGKSHDIAPGAVLKGKDFAAFLEKTEASYAEVVRNPNFKVTP
jgi:tripartite-type tricarboxylate transporter receptor subunit TctC